MKKIFINVLIIFVTLVSNFQVVYAQDQHVIDSLLSCYEKSTIDTIKADLLNKLSDEHLISNPEKAMDFAQQALSLAENIDYKNGVSVAYFEIGSVNRKKGNYNEALGYFEKSMKIHESLSNKIGISNCLNNIGIILYHQSNFYKSIENFEKSLNIFDELGKKIGVADCLNNIGCVYDSQSNYDKALEYHQKSLKIVREIGDKLGVSYSMLNIGRVYDKLGDYIKAMEYYQKSLKLKEDNQDKYGITICFNNIAGIYYSQGNYAKAIEYHQKSLKIAEELGSKSDISTSLANIGINHMKEKNYEKAIEYLKKALKIKEELDDKYVTSYCLSFIGEIHLYLSDYDKAIEYFERALNIKEKIEDKIGISQCLNNIGKVYLKQNNSNKALDNFNKALKISLEIGAKNEITCSNNLIAEFYLEKKDYRKALQYYQNALIANLNEFSDSSIYHNPNKLNAFSKPYLLETLSQKAKAFYVLFNKENNIKDIETSISTYELVFKLIYEMRNDYSHESTQLLLSENTKNYFAAAIEAAIAYNNAKQGHENGVKAFEYIEKSKSATLGAYLNDSKMKQNWHIADTLLNKERDIAIYRRFYETAIQKAKAKKEGYDTLLVQDYQDKLFDYSLQYDSLITTLKNEYPDYYKLKYEQNVASIKSVQHQLDNNSALINYFVGDSTLFISVVTNNLFAYKVVKTDSLFSQKIIDYHIDIKSGFTQKELDASAYLYQYLISPIEEYIKNKNKLVIIPDGDLYYLPFETLCKNASYSDDLSKIDYLVKNYSVSYHHSATLWLNSLEKTKTQVASSENFIGFAPVFDSKTNNGYILSREWMPDTTSTEIATRSVSIDFNHFNALPYSEEEIKSIVKLFSKKGKNAEGYFYRDASEESFKQNTRNYSYIHIASHSFANDYYPSLSGIAFSQPDTSIVNENEDDGILYAGETYNLDLPKAKLIVLSSCKSGLGKLVKGEGFLSLSRGFLYSGTPNIIFSLWNVKDEQTKDLMIQFYKQVLKGESFAESLREAKLKLIKNPKTAEPKYWAAWTLVGE